MVFLPASDIAAYVGEGNVDLGITGQDIIAESETPVNQLMVVIFFSLYYYCYRCY